MERRRREHIPHYLQDNTTYLKDSHNVLTHMCCISIRTLFGLSLIYKDSANNDNNKNKTIYRVFILTIFIFLMKYIFVTETWKCYLRTATALIVSFSLVLNKKTETAGIIIIADALMSIQSRYTGTLFDIPPHYINTDNMANVN